MNAPANAAPMREDVTPEDENAAQPFMDRFLDGSFFADDFVELSQAFARHRLAHTARPDADMAWRLDRIRDDDGPLTASDKAFLTEAANCLRTARLDAGDEAVERVARAIYDATHAGLRNCYSWDDRWEDHQEAGRERYYKESRAALGVMREGVDRGMVEREALENAINRMGWDEIHAFQNELRKGQDIYEDAGGFFMRAIKALFGIKPTDTVTAYQDAARALVTAALSPETPR